MTVRISNVVIVDGTGAGPFRGEVLIDGAQIGRVCAGGASCEADVVLDGRGGFLCPGFIDTHSHGDLGPFMEQGMRDKVMQGITTEVTGMCGLGVAPVAAEDRDAFRRDLIIGDPDITWSWQSFTQYLEAVRHAGLEHNLVPFAPHGVLRRFVAGQQSAPLASGQRDHLARLLNESFDAGAAGVSLGLIYLPALHADEKELRRVFDVAAERDRLVMVHMRSESDEILEALDEMIALAGRNTRNLPPISRSSASATARSCRRSSPGSISTGSPMTAIPSISAAPRCSPSSRPTCSRAGRSRRRWTPSLNRGCERSSRRSTQSGLWR